MQIIEVSVAGVRSAVITLRRPGTPMRFVLFPMVHLSSAEFLESVTARLRDCQLIVVEGVGRSAAGMALTLAYRLPSRSRRLGLVSQHINYVGLGIPVVRPDMTAQEFRQRWRSVPLAQRLAVWCLVPVFAVGFWLLGSRLMLGRELETNDEPTPDDDAAREMADGLFELIVDRRDAMLVRALAEIHEAHHAEPISVAVVYGAGHIPAVTHELLRLYGYRARSAEWLTVFDF